MIYISPDLIKCLQGVVQNKLRINQKHAVKLLQHIKLTVNKTLYQV